MKIFIECCFSRHQQQYILPTIVLSWRQSHSSLIAELRALNRGLVLAGDGRSDSPGHCAKYGAFTFIETKINKVLDIQQVQVWNIYLLNVYTFFYRCYIFSEVSN